MKKSNFLSKLKYEGKIELVEESEEVSRSYSMKADNCLRSAKILLKEKLFENSISEAYYSMYNSSLSLLFRCGIKCENHTAAIIMLKELFELQDESKTLAEAKKERIDKQYYVTGKQDTAITESDAVNMMHKAEELIAKLKVHAQRLNNSEISNIRKKFEGV